MDCWWKHESLLPGEASKKRPNGGGKKKSKVSSGWRTGHDRGANATARKISSASQAACGRLFDYC